MLLLALGGIVFAMIRWKFHPRASILTVIALLLFVLDLLGFFIVLNFMPDLIGSALGHQNGRLVLLLSVLFRRLYLRWC